MTRAYADASALVKLGLHEAESDAFVAAVAGHDGLLTSVVGRIEFERAIRRASLADGERIIVDALENVEAVPVHVAISGLAGAIRPPRLRTLDAIHLATMLCLQEDLDVAFIYDERLAAAARAYGIDVRAPA
jgi:predicted nucleic acid-binding protein